MTRNEIEQAMQQSSKTIKAIESRKESIILSASSVLEDKKLILDLCERVLGLSEALEEIKQKDPNLVSQSEAADMAIEFVLGAKEALVRFGVK